jgi:hypothetical protein
VIVAVLVKYRRYSLEDSKLLVRSKCPEALKGDGFKGGLQYSGRGVGCSECERLQAIRLLPWYGYCVVLM